MTLPRASRNRYTPGSSGSSRRRSAGTTAMLSRIGPRFRSDRLGSLDRGHFMPPRSTATPADLGFAQLLRAHGLRATAQRRAIYSVFAEVADADAGNAHLSAE